MPNQAEKCPHNQPPAYLKYLQTLWPRGAVYNRKSERVTTKLLAAIADMLAAAEAAICEHLTRNIDPCTADANHHAWRETTGIDNDACLAETADECATMKALLAGNAIEAEGQEAEYYIQLLMLHGIAHDDIQIINGSCAWVWGQSTWGGDCDNFNGPAPDYSASSEGWGSNAFRWGNFIWGGGSTERSDDSSAHWKVIIHNASQYPGYQLNADGSATIPWADCLLNRDKPSHTILFTDYRN